MGYLIKDTTKEERKKLVKNAFGISIASDEMPSKEVIELTKKYINGEMEFLLLKLVTPFFPNVLSINNDFYLSLMFDSSLFIVKSFAFAICLIITCNLQTNYYNI